MKKMSHHVLVLSTILLIAVRVSAVEPILMKWKVAGFDREALVVPPSAGKGAAPVVFFFHGHGGNMTAPSKNIAFQNLWPEAVVVYPQGLLTPSRVDPEGKKPGWQSAPGDQGDRDVKLFDAMLATVREKYPVNSRRIYATGFSNGAGFTYLLWSQRGQTLAAVAPCAGLIRDGVHPSPARPALIITGEADPLVKFPEAEKTIAEAKKINGCSDEGKPWDVPGCKLYASSSASPVVTFIHPGAHVVPQGANAMIVTFFKQHELGK